VRACAQAIDRAVAVAPAASSAETPQLRVPYLLLEAQWATEGRKRNVEQHSGDTSASAGTAGQARSGTQLLYFWTAKWVILCPEANPTTFSACNQDAHTTRALQPASSGRRWPSKDAVVLVH